MTLTAVALTVSAMTAVGAFAAAMTTGSSAMLSAAIHALICASSQALILYGSRLYGGQRSPQIAGSGQPSGQPSGRVGELQFWCFVVAVLLFAMGAGVTLYEGFEKYYLPRPVIDPHVNYAVLGVAFVLTAVPAWLAVQAVGAADTSTPARARRWRTRAPASTTVLIETIATLVAIPVAACGLLAADLGRWPPGDGLASIGIGLLLAFVAAFAAIELRGALAEADQRGHTEVERRGPAAGSLGAGKRASGVAGMTISARLDVAAAPDRGETADMAAVAGSIETAIRSAFPSVRHVAVAVETAGTAAAAATGSAGDVGDARDPPPPEPNPAAAAALVAPAAKPTLVTRPPHAKKGRGKRRR